MSADPTELRDFVHSFRPERVISNLTISRARDLDIALRVKQLIPQTGEENERYRGAQESIVNSVLEDVSEGGFFRFRTFVITGEAGVGKTTALRAIGREFALRFQESKSGNILLPILMPLQQVKIQREAFGSKEPSTELFWYLLRDWCAWVSRLTGQTITHQWLTKWLQANPCVLILDGLDEFFINNIWIDSDLIKQMLEVFRYTLDDGATAARPHTALLAIRNSYPGYDQFASADAHLFLIEKLTSEQASAVYPEMKHVIEGLRGSANLSVLLNPLILSSLAPRASQLRAESLQTKSIIMREALDTLIYEADLVSHLGRFGRINRSSVHTMLCVIGWLFFRDAKGLMTLLEVKLQSETLANNWSTEVPGLKTDSSIMRAFELLAHSEITRLLMERTVFVSTGIDEWRFAHREWEDYLTASYMANAYYYSNFVQMGHLAMTRAIFKMIGEILTTMPGKFEITESFTESVLGAGGIAAVNLPGVLGNSELVVHPRAIHKLLSIDTLDHLNKTARLVVFTAVMYRALRQARTDPSASELRRALIIVCNEYGKGGNDEHRDALSASLAWCYHKAMAAGDRRLQGPQVEWPGLGFKPEHEEPVLSMLTAGREQQFEIKPHHRSLQVAWLQVLPIVMEDSYRPVSIVHYLYAVVVVYKHAAHIPEIARELPLILASDSKYAEIFRAYEQVPEIWELFTYCQEAYRSAAGFLGPDQA